MKWSGTNEQRTAATNRYLRYGVEGLLEGRVGVDAGATTADARSLVVQANAGREQAGANAGRTPGNQGTGNRSSVESRVQRVVATVAGLSDNGLANLGLTPEDRDAARKSLGDEYVQQDRVESNVKLSQPRFNSQLEQTVAQVPARISTQPAPQWKAWLASNASKFGIKKDEIEWSGINNYLDLRGKEKVTAKEIGEYLDLNNVKIDEVN